MTCWAGRSDSVNGIQRKRLTSLDISHAKTPRVYDLAVLDQFDCCARYVDNLHFRRNKVVELIDECWAYSQFRTVNSRENIAVLVWPIPRAETHDSTQATKSFGMALLKFRDVAYYPLIRSAWESKRRKLTDYSPKLQSVDQNFDRVRTGASACTGSGPVFERQRAEGIPCRVMCRCQNPGKGAQARRAGARTKSCVCLGHRTPRIRVKGIQELVAAGQGAQIRYEARPWIGSSPGKAAPCLGWTKAGQERAWPFGSPITEGSAEEPILV
jgi:hypothetical protein